MVLDAIHSFFFDVNDLETKVNFGHPWIPPTIILLYIIFCKWLGSALMRNRKPFNLKNTIIVYNFGQVLANAYIVVQLIKLVFVCWPIRCIRHEVPELYGTLLEQTKLIQWHIYLIKFVDLLDAVFFVLRKKEKQVTFLHMFHHVMVCSFCFVYINELDYGFLVLLAVTINTFVHIVMYLYYALAAFGPEMQKYLWWKKYLTLMQITQFLIILAYMGISLSTGCDRAGLFEINFFLLVLTILFLFLNFYRKSYKSK